MNKDTIIPWAKPVFWGDEAGYLEQALSSEFISGGPFVERFEKELATHICTSFALTASNGTAALHLAYLALGLEPGDEVVVPGFSFMAAANIAVHMGAKPVFADVDPETWCISADSIEKCLTDRSKIIVPIHTYGNVCAMDEIVELAKSKNIAVVEDTAEALFSLYKGKSAGTFGDIGTYSFHATKTITTGEGGAVITDSEFLQQKMSLYRSHGMLRNTYYWHELAGHNFRLTNLQAALGCAQLRYLNSVKSNRLRLHNQYRTHLENVAGLRMQLFIPEVEPVLWAMAIKLDREAFPQGRDEVMAAMAEAGIETRPGFYTARNFTYLQGPLLPISEELSHQVISLPTFPSLTNEEIEYIYRQLVKLKK